ncbi:DMP19 family protein [Hymenobacter sp. J193]|uniref:DMP19 family protein n=1 Tax=Hymenobacter sp. J193 TaxID=2898429 RepID=UPI002151F3C3|nr:DMP19 family protein [Hymenobacter sp. J193]MCR5888423.1 DMP19 family protein [Hymenobacter sp. J193]
MTSVPSSTGPVDSSVIVSKDSFDNPDAYAVVYSNITFVNALRSSYFTNQELAPDALRSYYVDYYLAQVNNGGFSQFVYNSGWDADMVRTVREGLASMEARQHLALFERGAQLIDGLGAAGLQAYLEDDYWGDNDTRDELNSIGDEFFQLSEQEDLVDLNARWLRGLPNLRVLTIPQMEAEVDRRIAALPDFAFREAQARANEPRYYKVSRALCKQAGQELVSVNAFDGARYQGRKVQATHISTNQGHHYWFEENGRAFLLNTKGRLVTELDITASLTD